MLIPNAPLQIAVDTIRSLWGLMLLWQMEGCWPPLVYTWLPWRPADMQFLLLYLPVFIRYVKHLPPSYVCTDIAEPLLTQGCGAVPCK